VCVGLAAADLSVIHLLGGGFSVRFRRPWRDRVSDEELDQFDDLDGDDPSGSGSDGDDAGAPPAQGKAPESKESKRVNDLMGKWQSEQERNKRLQAQLDELKGKKTTDGDGQPAPDPEREAWIEAQRDFARERGLNSDPRLADYGLTSDDITGNTPAEIKASVKRWTDVIDAIETKARNRVLAEHGLSPEVAGGSAPKVPDVASLSDDDFEALVRRAKNGG
jgi:hypothetical protein